MSPLASGYSKFNSSMSGLSGVVQMAKVDEKLVYDSLDDIDTLPQHWNDVIPLKRLFLSERYAIGWADIGFLLSVSHVAVSEGPIIGRPLEQLNFIRIRMRNPQYAHRGSKSNGKVAGNYGLQECFVKIQNLHGQN